MTQAIIQLQKVENGFTINVSGHPGFASKQLVATSETDAKRLMIEAIDHIFAKPAKNDKK